MKQRIINFNYYETKKLSDKKNWRLLSTQERNVRFFFFFKLVFVELFKKIYIYISMFYSS